MPNFTFASDLLIGPLKDTQMVNKLPFILLAYSRGELASPPHLDIFLKISPCKRDIITVLVSNTE